MRSYISPYTTLKTENKNKWDANKSAACQKSSNFVCIRCVPSTMIILGRHIYMAIEIKDWSERNINHSKINKEWPAAMHPLSIVYAWGTQYWSTMLLLNVYI